MSVTIIRSVISRCSEAYREIGSILNTWKKVALMSLFLPVFIFELLLVNKGRLSQDIYYYLFIYYFSFIKCELPALFVQFK